MSKKVFFTLIVCLGVMLIFSSILNAQPYSIKLYLSDTDRTDSLVIGTHPSATYGIDPALGEQEWPPAGPQIMDVRLIDLPGRSAMGQGLVVDYRPYLLSNQTDSFRILFKSGGDVGPYGPMTFRWPANISNFGAGYWMLVVPADEERGISEQIIDMAAQPGNSFTHPYADRESQEVYIIVVDRVKYRTFPSDSIVKAVDSKNKPKAEKMKPYNSRARFSFTNNTGVTVNKLVVAYGQAILSHYANPWPSAAVVGKVVTYSGMNVTNGSTIEIEVRGDKGKLNKAKAQWFKDDMKQGAAFVPPVVGTQQLLLPNPNFNNMGEELYGQGAFTPADKGLVVGIAGNPKHVFHPKYKDVQKTIGAGKIPHTGDPKCLDKFANDKPILAPQKSLPSGKHNNKLLTEAIALKLNIAMSDKDKVEGGYPYGDLIYKSENPYLNGKKVREISVQIDSFLSCIATVKEGALTAAEWFAVAKQLNDEFMGKFDTLQWAGKLVMKAVKQVGLSKFLYRDPSLPPVTPTPDIRNLEAETPATYSLAQNYPNPFNPTTMIQFTLPEDAFVTIKVYNLLGQEVKTLVDMVEYCEGEHSEEFDAGDFASGVYFYRIIVNDLETGALKFQNVKKMLLVK